MAFLNDLTSFIHFCQKPKAVLALGPLIFALLIIFFLSPAAPPPRPRPFPASWTQLDFTFPQAMHDEDGRPKDLRPLLAQPLIWHGEDEQNFYHLTLRPPHTAIYQVVAKTIPGKVQTFKDKINLTNWARGKAQPLVIKGQMFTYPQVSPQGIYIQQTKTKLKLYARLTLMNYNVENLWDADPYNSDPAIMSFYEPFQKDKSNWYDPRIQTKVIQNFINVLQAAGLPDIITLQEIEAAANQSKVLAASAPLTKKLKELGYQTFIVGPQEENHPVAITTAVISRYPLQAYPSLKLNASTYQQFAPHLKGRHGRHARDIQIVGLSLAGTQTFFLVQHWAAAWQNARPRTPSIAQIHQANSMALKEGLACKKNKNLNPVSAFPWCRAAARPHPAAKIILVGDFNTHLGSPALPPAPWINLWMTLPPTQRWESVWQGRPGTLAHIILAPSFTQAAGLQYLPGSFKVQRDFLLNVDGTPLRRQYLKEKPRGKIFYRFSGEGYSDHLPLLATFNIFPPGLPILPLKMKQQKYTSAALGTSPQRPPANCPPLTEKDLERPARGGCFTVDLRAHPRPLKTAGIYRHNYIEWGTHKLYLVMEDIWAGSASLGPKGEKEWPKKALENFCINRQILQKRGSHLVYARGKLGFFKDGWALYLSTRQDFRLTHLSRRKALACR